MGNVPRMAFLNPSASNFSTLVDRLVQGLWDLEYAVYYGAQPIDEQLSTLSITMFHEQRFAINVRSKLHGLELSIEGGWGEKWLARSDRLWISGVTYQSAWFGRGTDQVLTYSNHLVEVGHLLYGVSQADFGWIDICEPAGYFWFDDVEQCNIDAVHWASGRCAKRRTSGSVVPSA